MEIWLRWGAEFKSKQSALSVEGGQQWSPVAETCWHYLQCLLLFFHIFNGYVEVKLPDCWPLLATFL